MLLCRVSTFKQAPARRLRSKTACTAHIIYENALTQLVLADIREKAQFAVCDREKRLDKIVRMKDEQRRDRMISFEKELKATAARVSELEKGVSLHREGLEKVTHALETGQAKTLLVMNLSRICRRSKDMEAYLDRLEHQKITLICADGTDPCPYRTIYRSLMKLASKE